MASSLSVRIACPTCGLPVMRHVPVRNDIDDKTVPFPTEATGICTVCHPWDDEASHEAYARTLEAVRRREGQAA